MSDAPAGKGGFGQFAAQYRDRWTASHPELSKEWEPRRVSGRHPLDQTANVNFRESVPARDGVIPIASRTHAGSSPLP
jgi:hypothetical protein